MKKYADINMSVTVEFDDDGESALPDQAIDAVDDQIADLIRKGQVDISVVGPVRDTEMPEQPQ